MKLGQLIQGNPGRDAVHIAIMPVTAGFEHEPGDSVAVIWGGDGFVTTLLNDSIGIIDPFLDTTVKQGEQCYLCLYPDSITDLRHVWSHPKVRIPC